MNDGTVAFDLETIADYELLKMMPAPEVKLGNLKDEDKIKAKIADAEKNRLEKMGLNPHENLICLCSWANINESGYILLEEANGKAERELLLKAWEILHQYDHFVTFNGIEFDVPVINLHSLFRKVRPAVNISTKKYQITNHTDLRAVLGNWDKFSPGKMDFYLRRCLGKSKPENIDGSMIQHLWDCGMYDEIIQYGVGDAEDTLELYHHVKEFYPGLA